MIWMRGFLYLDTLKIEEYTPHSSWLKPTFIKEIPAIDAPSERQAKEENSCAQVEHCELSEYHALIALRVSYD